MFNNLGRNAMFGTFIVTISIAVVLLGCSSSQGSFLAKESKKGTSELGTSVSVEEAPKGDRETTAPAVPPQTEEQELVQIQKRILKLTADKSCDRADQCAMFPVASSGCFAPLDDRVVYSKKNLDGAALVDALAESKRISDKIEQRESPYATCAVIRDIPPRALCVAQRCVLPDALPLLDDDGKSLHEKKFCSKRSDLPVEGESGAASLGRHQVIFSVVAADSDVSEDYHFRVGYLSIGDIMETGIARFDRYTIHMTFDRPDGGVTAHLVGKTLIWGKADLEFTEEACPTFAP